MKFLLITAAFACAAVAHAQQPGQAEAARCFALVKPDAKAGDPSGWQAALRCLEMEKEKAGVQQGEAWRALQSQPSVPASTPSRSYEDPRQWESANLTRSENTGDALLRRCYYRTGGGYEFSVVKRDSGCPYFVSV